jgi:hypothetical protein
MWGRLHGEELERDWNPDRDREIAGEILKAIRENERSGR